MWCVCAVNLACGLFNDKETAIASVEKTWPGVQLHCNTNSLVQYNNTIRGVAEITIKKLEVSTQIINVWE